MIWGILCICSKFPDPWRFFEPTPNHATLYDWLITFRRKYAKNRIKFYYQRQVISDWPMGEIPDRFARRDSIRRDPEIHTESTYKWVWTSENSPNYVLIRCGRTGAQFWLAQMSNIFYSALSHFSIIKAMTSTVLYVWAKGTISLQAP